MGLMTRGAKFLNRAMGASAGVPVLYSRGPLEWPLLAWAGQQQSDGVTSPALGTRSTDRERDYMISWASLVAAGFGEPRLGDRITETIRGAAVVFELCKRDREPHWRWADHGRTRVRVNSRFVRTSGPDCPPDENFVSVVFGG